MRKPHPGRTAGKTCDTMEGIIAAALTELIQRGELSEWQKPCR